MLKHAFKLAWKRKRASLLLILEFTAVFLVLAAASTFGIYYARNASAPLGFTSADVWHVSIESGNPGEDQYSDTDAARFASALAVVRNQPFVEAASGVEFAPYGFSSSQGAIDRDGGRLEFGRNTATDDFARVMQLHVTAGRWFGREDDGATYVPMVVNEAFARGYFGTTAVAGREIEAFAGDYGKPVRVVGVIDAFRQNGEYAAPAPYLFTRAVLGDTTQRPPHALFVRVRPGTPEVQLGALVAALERAFPEADVQGQTLPNQRASYLRLALIPLGVVSLVALFLVLMALLGLTGILWQNLTRRTAELGLRRALGAARTDVLRQVALEVFALATFGAALGLIVAGHLPLFGLFGLVPPGQFVSGLVLGLALLYGAVVLCALYPARLATRLDPAEALRAE